jgi:hypothetical protein
MRARLAAALVAVLALSACGGNAAEAPVSTTNQPAPTVNPGRLDTGSYATKPSGPVGVAITEEAGRDAEGRRMADVVVGPWQVDPTLTSMAGGGPALMTKFTALTAVLYPSTLYRVQADSFVAGFSSERSAADPKVATKLRNAVLRFPDPDTATNVARGWTEGQLTMLVRQDSIDPIPSEPIRPIAIPGHPEVMGTLLAFLDGAQTVRQVTLISAHGPFVLVQTARAADGPEHAAALAGRALDLQLPALDRFQPTAIADMAALPLDPTGLVARTLPVKSDPNAMVNATYAPPGYLHLADDPIRTDRALADGGVDVVSAGLTTVFQARDHSAAETLATGFADAAAQQPNSQQGAPVPGLPESRCVSIGGAVGAQPRYHCFASVDRFAFTSESKQPAIAQQQIAAQFKMLTA